MTDFANQPATTPEQPAIDLTGLLDLLTNGTVTAHDDIPWGSNYTFLIEIEKAPWRTLAVYKPQRGETPLWDFRTGTLCYREYAAYLVSEALGWWLVPPTTLREGPFGLGAVQLYVNADPNETFFDLPDNEFSESLMKIAAFDALTNNADRKGGHILRDRGTNRLWAIDHGLTFHTEYKLRTVIWNFAGRPLPRSLMDDLAKLREQLQKEQPLTQELTKLLSASEVGALRQRLNKLLSSGTYPQEHPRYQNVPWPPV